MPVPVTVSTVDSILAVHLTVAWSGESRERDDGRRCTTKRLGGWQTDPIDSTGGALLAYRLPRTHASRTLEACEPARRADETSRRGMADPDQVRTLSFLGFDFDERFAELKRRRKSRASTHAFPLVLYATFSRENVAEALELRGGAAPADDVPDGRQLKGVPPVAPKFKLSEVDDWVRREVDSADDHAPAVPIDDRLARMSERRGRT